VYGLLSLAFRLLFVRKFWNLEKLTTTNHILLSLARTAEQKGLDVLCLLNKANIDPGFLQAPHLRISTQKLADFVRFISNELQDENLGLCPYPARPGTFFTMGELVIHQPNLDSALRRGLRFFDQVVDGYKMELVVEGETASLILYQPYLDMDPDHLLTDLILLAFHRFFSWLIGDNIVLLSTHFTYSPPAYIDEYKFLFPSHHHFFQAHSSFSFHVSFLQKPVIQNKKTLKTFMYQCPAILFLRPRSDKSLATRVHKLIQKNMENGMPDLKRVAEWLSMSNRTVRRKLKEEGTSFQALKDLVRRDVAIDHLVQHALPVGTVAERLGYSEPGVFVRAFKKWTGTTPGTYRKYYR